MRARTYPEQPLGESRLLAAAEEGKGAERSRRENYRAAALRVRRRERAGVDLERLATAYEALLKVLREGEAAPPPDRGALDAAGVDPADERITPLVRRYLATHRHRPVCTFIAPSQPESGLPPGLYWRGTDGRVELDILMIGAPGPYRPVGRQMLRSAERLFVTSQEAYGDEFAAVWIVSLSRDGRRRRVPNPPRDGR